MQMHSVHLSHSSHSCAAQHCPTDNNRRHPRLSSDSGLENQCPIYECGLPSPTTLTILDMPRATRCAAGGRGKVIDITWLPLHSGMTLLCGPVSELEPFAR
jgi:hypothetical protein